MTLIEPPATVNFGFVTGRFALAVADTAQDDDHLPNFVPAAGTVSFRPATTKIVAGTPARFISPQTVTSTLNSAGVISDGNGLSGIWLIVGVYTVSFKLAGLTVSSFDITVTASHTVEAPLDLVLHTPAPIEPNVKFVVNEQVYTETIAARNEVVALLEGVQGGLGAGIDDQVADVDTTWSSTKISADLASKANTSHTHATSQVTGLDTALAGKASTTHSHATSEVTGLDTALAGKAPTSHTHTIANVTSLQSTLDAKAAATHSHAVADTTGLQAALDAKAASSHSHATSDVTGLDTALAGKAASSHTHTTAQVTGLDTALSGKATTAQGAKADTAVQPAAIAYMVTSPNDTVRTIERHGSQAAIPTPYVAKRVYLVPDEA